MEALTPVQRVAVVAIGLTLTVVLALLILPWLSKQISDRLAPTVTPSPPTAAPEITPTPVTLRPAETPASTPASVRITSSPASSLVAL